MACSSARASTSRPSLDGTTATRSPESLRRASVAGTSACARSASSPFWYLVGSTLTTGATACEPPGSQTFTPSGSL